MNDCRLLVASIENYAEGFLTQWNTNIHKFKSLPGIAEYIAYQFYDTDCPPIYTFGPNFAKFNQQIRSQLHGGMTMVLHRMISLHEPSPEFPLTVFQNSDGDRYKRITTYDFNSLYPFAFSQDLPTGPGFLLSRDNNEFKLKSMHQSGKQSSLMAVEWLEYLQSTNPELYKKCLLNPIFTVISSVFLSFSLSHSCLLLSSFVSHSCTSRLG